jgi:hypothetical protein
MPEDPNLIVTLSSPVAIVAIVNWLKALGVRGRWATLAAVAVALLIGTAEMYLDSEVYAQCSTYLLMGLAAAGFYDLSKNVGTAVSVPVVQGDAAVGRVQVEQEGSLVATPAQATLPAQRKNASGQKIGDAAIRTTESQLREKQ